MSGSYNFKLITMSILISCIAVFLTLGIIKRLFTSDKKTKSQLYIFSVLLVSSGLWGLHFLDLLAFPPGIISSGYLINYIGLSWVAAYITALSVTYVSSQKNLPLSFLLLGSGLAGLGGFSIFYFNVKSLKVVTNVTFIPHISILCILAAIAVSMLIIIVLFWLKSYSGSRPISTNILFSIIVSVAMTGVHLTYNYAVFIEPPNTLISANYNLQESTLLGIVIALGCVCLFCIAFIVAIFYDKLNHNTFRFNRIKMESSTDLSRLAMIDTLTKLPNRRALQQNLEAGTRRCLRTNSSMALAFIDLDNFKPINDNYGHQTGDEVLINVANRLNAAVRNCDVVTRIGGDEFVALIEDIKSNEDIVPILERIVHTINEPFFVKQHQLFISASVGVAVFPKDGNLEQLISCADAAMYRAKSDGKNQFRFFDTEIELASDQMLEMQKDLKSALANDEFKLQFQLKIDSELQMPVGAEVFIRWNHPSKGLILPNSFIPEAERFGLICQINNWVIEEACRTVHRMRSHGIALNLSVNLSPQQFRNPNLADDIKVVLARFELPHDSIIFEISEAAVIKNSELLGSLLSSFKAADLKIAIDNFGANPFNLAYLKNLEISELKLDKLFTADISTNNETSAIVEAVIRLAHTLKFSVTAEGVETESQRKILAKLGCNQMQGYLFSRPMAEIKLVEMLKQLDSEHASDDTLFVKDYLKTINNSKE